jgi:alkylation response protein AidB-like acyl-CoA dehydrogenase
MPESVTDLDEYRARARAWLEDHLPRRETGAAGSPGTHRESVVDYTRAQIDAERPKQRQLFEAGYAGITVPREYGGQGLTAAHERVFGEEAGAFELPDFGTAGRTTNVCMKVVLAHGSEDVKRRHAPRMLAGDELWIQLFSEPEAGSDLAGIRTRATRDGESWVLNGAKVWTTFAHLADWGLCLTRTDWQAPKHKGLTWFGVPLDVDGLTIRVLRQLTGGGDFCEEFLDDVCVPDTERIGEVNDGWAVARTMLIFERGATREPSPALIDPGALASDLVDAARHAGATDDALTRQLVARGHAMDVLYQALRARVGQALSSPGANEALAAYGKLAHGMFAAERAQIGLQIGRAASATWAAADDPGAAAATAFLNGRVLSIAGGTEQMQRNAISEQVLGLPREPSADKGKPFEQVIRGAATWGQS